MKSLALLTAVLIMLRVSGLAPDLPWGWAFAPIWMPMVALAVFVIAGLAINWRGK